MACCEVFTDNTDTYQGNGQNLETQEGREGKGREEVRPRENNKGGMTKNLIAQEGREGKRREGKGKEGKGRGMTEIIE